MQTFLCYPSFVESAKCLDRQRLGKQRVEAKQILDVLISNPDSRWRNHPAVLMWKGYEDSLVTYGKVICKEWIKRGYKDTLLEWFEQQIGLYRFGCPTWLGNSKFHLSHQSNLVRKFPEHYRQYFPDVPDNLPYFWPTKEGY